MRPVKVPGFPGERSGRRQANTWDSTERLSAKHKAPKRNEQREWSPLASVLDGATRPGSAGTRFPATVSNANGRQRRVVGTVPERLPAPPLLQEPPCFKGGRSFAASFGHLTSAASGRNLSKRAAGSAHRGATSATEWPPAAGVWGG